MAHVPLELIKLLEQIEEKNIASVCRKLHLTDTRGYKSYSVKVAKKNCEKEYLLTVFSGGSDLHSLYSAIEPYLFIGGCAPGIGITFNIIDACFCAALGNYIGVFVAIISCFPIPGFKAVGKGLEKGMSLLLKKIVGEISWHTIPDGMKLLEKQLTKIGLLGVQQQGLHTINKFSLKPIEEQLERMFLEWNNPFAESVVKNAFKLVFSLQDKAIKKSSQFVGDFSKFDVNKHGITKFGTLLIR